MPVRVLPGDPDGGDSAPQSVEDFCRTLRPRLLGTLRLECDHHVAEELTQETLSRVYERWDTVREMHSPQAWAYSVAFNLARSTFRRVLAERRAVRRHAARPAAASTGLDHADVLAVRWAVADLPVRQRTAVVLRYYADLSVEEVALVMDCAPGTVTAHTRDAIVGLRRRVREPDESTGVRT